MAEDFGGDFEGMIGGWNAAVNGGVEQEFLDFLRSDAVVERNAEMEAKFLFTIEGDGHS